MVTVITYGTFDLLHIGHIRLLRRCKNLGDRLLVGVSTDDFNRVKGKAARFSFAERLEIISSLGMVDYAFPEMDWEQKLSDFRKYNANILCMGDDWRSKFDCFSDVVRVVYLERTPGISSSQLRVAQ